jgi:signal peptidase I
MSRPVEYRPSLLRAAWRWLRPLAIATAVLFAFRSAAVDWNVVPTGSMQPTIVEGDYIVVNKLAYDLKVPFAGWQLLRWGGPQRGDIVVFDPPGERERYVKRVVAVPGDLLELRDNHLFLNNQPARYTPLEAGQGRGDRDAVRRARETVAGRTHAIQLADDPPGPASFGPVVVPPRHYFVMGDNRDNSKDSRFFGFVSRERIVGRVGRVLLSLDPLLGKQPRWARFGLALW